MAIHTILLIRHGEASASWGDHADPGLSDNGKKQADELTNSLRAEDLSEFNFISSPKLRAIQTAQPLAEQYEKNLDIHHAFSEIPSHDIPNKEKQDWLRKIMSEEMSALPDQVKLWHQEIMETIYSLEENSIIFCHFMVINAIVASALRHNELLYFYPNYTSCSRLLIKDSKIEEIILGDDKKTLINL